MTDSLRLKHVASVLAGQSPPSSEVSTFDGADGVPFLQGNAEFGKVHPSPVYQSATAPRRAHVGDILVSVRAPVGAVNVADREYGIGRGLAAVRARMIDPGFARWLIEHSAQWLNSIATGSTFTAVSGADVGNVVVPVYDLVEQRAIADYLDRETAQIDAFIAKNEELIARIEERRSSMVDVEITGARDEAKATRPSRWFGQLPSGWREVPVKGVSKRVTDGAHISPETEGGVFDFVSTRDLMGGSIEFEGSLKTSPDTYEYMVRTGCRPLVGDVLYSKDGTIGTTAVVREDREFVVASSLVIISPRPTVVPEYLRYALSARPTLEQARTLVRGAGLPRLSVANLGRVVVPMPSYDEQLGIVARLDSIIERTTRAVETARRAIALARERRAALISAAVTGKIDVGVAA